MTIKSYELGVGAMTPEVLLKCLCRAVSRRAAGARGRGYVCRRDIVRAMVTEWRSIAPSAMLDIWLHIGLCDCHRAASKASEW